MSEVTESEEDAVAGHGEPRGDGAAVRQEPAVHPARGGRGDGDHRDQDPGGHRLPQLQQARQDHPGGVLHVSCAT